MTPKTRVIVSVLALVTAFALGRYTVSSSSKSTETASKEKASETSKEVSEHKKTVTTEVERPDGTKERTTTITDDVDTKTASKGSSSSTTEKTSEVVKGSSDKVTISALGGVSIKDWSMVYGASVSRPILGPVAVGVWGLSNSTGGFSIGLGF
jgi:hypothetical protein